MCVKIENPPQIIIYFHLVTSISLVLPGNERDAKDLSRLRSLDIRYVLNVTSHVPQYFDCHGIRYKRIPASDSSQQNLRQYFEEAIEYIGEYLL